LEEKGTPEKGTVSQNPNRNARGFFSGGVCYLKRGKGPKLVSLQFFGFFWEGLSFDILPERGISLQILKSGGRGGGYILAKKKKKKKKGKGFFI